MFLLIYVMLSQCRSSLWKIPIVWRVQHFFKYGGLEDEGSLSELLSEKCSLPMLHTLKCLAFEMCVRILNFVATSSTLSFLEEEWCEHEVPLFVASISLDFSFLAIVIHFQLH